MTTNHNNDDDDNNNNTNDHDDDDNNNKQQHQKVRPHVVTRKQRTHSTHRIRRHTVEYTQHNRITLYARTLAAAPCRRP